MRYLGIELKRPKVAVFDFTACEGCELQFTNKEETLVDFLKAVEVVNFREASSAKGEDYDIAFIEGSISRQDEVERIKHIRAQAKVLVAMGACAVTGGVHRMKNDYDLTEANREVYGDMPKETLPVRSIKEVVPVDYEIYGCPISKAEVEKVVMAVVRGITYMPPVHPVCIECKQRFTSCMMQKGHLCLGTITRAGCNAPCPAGGLGCWGCRGPAEQPNYAEFFAMTKERGFSDHEVKERMNFFATFQGVK